MPLNRFKVCLSAILMISLSSNFVLAAIDDPVCPGLKGGSIDLIPSDHCIRNSELAKWKSNRDRGTEIGGVVGGVLGYLILIYIVSFFYGQY